MFDSDPTVGDDIFNDGYQSGAPADTLRPAKHSIASVYEKTTGTIWGQEFGFYLYKWSGFLDEDGCTPKIGVAPDTQYHFSQGTMVEASDSNGPYRITILDALDPQFPLVVWPDEGTAEEYSQTYWMSTDYQTASTLPPWVLNIDIAPHTSDPNQNAAAVYGEVLDKIDILDIGAPPAARRTLVSLYEQQASPPPFSAIYNTRCDVTKNGGHSTLSNGDSRICLPFLAAGWKNILAHEFGHAQCRTWDWVAHGIPDPDSDNSGYTTHDPNVPLLCQCEHAWNTVDDEGHCLQSREYTHVGISEGWAHFIALATYNNRDDVDSTGMAEGYFGYYGALCLGVNPITQDCITNPAPNPVHAADPVQWMESNCDPGDADRGVEGDWLKFFYYLWADKQSGLPLRFEIAEFGEILHGANGQRWDQVRDYVDIAYFANPAKAMRFEQTGFDNGVDHTTNP